MDRERSIGVFDSGIGGLTVVRALAKRLPFENIVYFGDTARVPYGSKSSEVVRRYAWEDASFLIEKGVKMIVAACNTASAVALDDLRARLDVPVVGMITPGVQKALRISSEKRIGIIGTLATIASDAYAREISTSEPSARVFSKACPLFVPLAEEGWGEHVVSRFVAEEYLGPFKREDIDCLILGCTHYPILRSVIQQAIGEDVRLVDSGEAAADQVAEILAVYDLLNDSKDSPAMSYYVSDVPQRFRELGEIFLGKPDMSVTKVNLP